MTHPDRTAGETGPAVDPDPRASEQRARLIQAGLLVPSGIDGLVGFSGEFDSIAWGLQDLITREVRDVTTTVVRFPPAMPRLAFERTGYLRSFPHLIGSVHGFEGGDREHSALIRALEEGRDWTNGLVPLETVLCSAACHPLYPTISGSLPDGGRRWDVFGWVFRHEPSVDPARLQAFRMYEMVYVGEPDQALLQRDRWLDQGLALLSGLGLEVNPEVAQDPFFGRIGQMLATNQRSEALKYELVAATSTATMSAIASANYHGDHFGVPFSITTADGSTAHSACVGFGIERIALALLWRHGLEIAAWADDVKGALWP